MAISFEEFKAITEATMASASEEEKVKLRAAVDTSKPFFDFSDYIKNKLNIGEEAYDKLVELKMNLNKDTLDAGIDRIINESGEDGETLAKNLVEFLTDESLNILIEFAEEQEYPDIEGLRGARPVLEITLGQQIANELKSGI